MASHRQVAHTFKNRLTDLFGEVADITYADEPFSPKLLYGKLPLLERYSLHYQQDVVGWLLKEMIKYAANDPQWHDGLVKLRPGVYKWHIAPKE